MSDTVLSMASAHAESRVQRGWIESPFFDLALFTLSPLVGLAVVLMVRFHPAGTIAAVAATFILGVPHYLSTFTFFVGDENRAHYLARPLGFVLVPLLIFATVLGLRVVHLDSPVIILMFVWNIWHVALQSTGILGIYRRLHGGPDRERTIAKTSLFTTGAAMALWQPSTFPPLHDGIEWLHKGLYRIISVGFVAAAIVSTVTLLVLIARRPQRMSFAETSFLLSSLLLFHPFLWVPDGQQATLAMLCGHFIQYLGIVWLLNARRYGRSNGSVAERLLGTASSRPHYALVIIVLTGVAAWAGSHVAAALGVPMAFIIGLNSLALIHFYLDGRFWGFRDPYVRKSIGPFLLPEDRRVAS